MTIQQLLNHTSQSITTAAVVLGGASLLAKVLGLARDRLLTHTFGAGATLDAYYAAFRVPDFLYNLLVLGVLSAAFIPLFTHWWSRDRSRAWEFLNRAVTTLGALLAVISLACVLLAPVLVRVIAPGFDGEKYLDTVALTRIMMISPLLLGISAAVGGALQSLKKFFIYALAPIMYNIGIIVGVLAFVPLFGIRGLALGVVLGALLHVIVQIPALVASGFRPQLLWGWRHADVRELLKLTGPRMVALAAAQINIVVLTMFASLMGDGAIAVFDLANNIQSFPIGIIAVSFAVAAFPVMSEFAAADNPDGLAKTINATLRLVMTWIIPVAVLFVVLRAQWVRIILGSGAFDWNATIATADALGFFSLGMLGQSLVHVLARGFYALKDTRTPAVVGLSSVALGIVLALWLRGPLGVGGLACAVAVQSTLNAGVLWYLLNQRIGSLASDQTLHTFYKLCIAGLAMVGITQGLKIPIASVVDTHTFLGIFLQALGASLGGLVAFFGIGLVLKIEEIFVIVSATKIRVKKIVQLLPIDVSDANVQH